MERALNVRIPEVLAAKMDRFAAAQGMTQSELVRAALRSYFTTMLREDMAAISAAVRPRLEADGVTADNVQEWFKKERKKKPATSKASKPSAVRA